MRNNPCLGSHQPPLSQSNQVYSACSFLSDGFQRVVVANVSEHAVGLSLLEDFLYIKNIAGEYVNDIKRFCNLVLRGPIIKHTPKSTRQYCNETSQFWKCDARRSSRGGKKHNLTSPLLFRLTSDSLTEAVARASNKRIRNTKALAESVTSNTEDCIIKAALQMLCSDEKPAADCETTIATLKERHPPAVHAKQPSPAPRSFADLQVTEAEVNAVIWSFFTGSAGRLDGIHPQHILDLSSKKEWV